MAVSTGPGLGYGSLNRTGFRIRLSQQDRVSDMAVSTGPGLGYGCLNRTGSRIWLSQQDLI